ncbi:MAG: nucleotidyltransferase family protein [Anaerolineae bacterium]
MTDPFVAYWKQQQARRREQNRRLAQEARRDLDRIAHSLRTTYGARRIILFGSLVKDRFAAGSDIDLAVAGIAPADFFSACAEANRLSRFRVDLKPYDDLHPRFQQRVLAQGEVIYEASE